MEELWGQGKPIFIIAEVAQAHDGSLGNALAYIDAVAEAGASAVKFQYHLPEEGGRFRKGAYFPQDSTRSCYWERTGFSPAEWQSLHKHAKAAGLAFGVSCFSAGGVRRFPCKPDFWKVPSGEADNHDIIRDMRIRAAPIVRADGFDVVRGECVDGYGQECTEAISKYPTPPGWYSWTVNAYDRDNGLHGLSDHSGEIWPALAAATIGVRIIEVHVCWHKSQFGPDTSSSLDMQQFAQMVEGVRWIERMDGSAYDQSELDAALAAYREGKNG